jgi:hypothetical protein
VFRVNRPYIKHECLKQDFHGTSLGAQKSKNKKERKKVFHNFVFCVCGWTTREKSKDKRQKSLIDLDGKKTNSAEKFFFFSFS